VPCLSYYQASEISVSVTANAFVLAFARPLQTSLRTCMEVFSPESMALLGYEPQCHFRVSSIKVILGTDFELRQANLSLDSHNVVASGIVPFQRRHYKCFYNCRFHLLLSPC